MNTINEHTPVRDAVIGSIKSGKARMKPKWHFVFRAALAAVGMFIAAIGIVYLASFIHFILRQNGVWFAPSFGAHGVWILLLSLPWLLIGAVILFIVILEVLVRRYSFAYKQPLMYSLIGVIGFATLATFVVARTGMHDTAYRAVREGSLPIGAPMYGPLPLTETSEVHPGVITAITGEHSFAIERVDGSVMSVEITDETKIPKGYAPQEDDEIIIIGHSKKSTVSAWGIRPVTKETFVPFTRRQKERRDKNRDTLLGEYRAPKDETKNTQTHRNDDVSDEEPMKDNER
ncbi:MAG: DUF4401 domain-containing protein [Candidatus Yonathbacteria bacterium]|nr:DUF4401 domain-containing protein [Candidatus Yonathbacteria bacterium]